MSLLALWQFLLTTTLNAQLLSLARDAYPFEGYKRYGVHIDTFSICQIQHSLPMVFLIHLLHFSVDVTSWCAWQPQAHSSASAGGALAGLPP